MRCPSCGRDVPDGGGPAERPASWPFCGRTCKLADLGRWLDGSHALEGEPVNPSDLPPRSDA